MSDGGAAGTTITCQELVETVTEYLEGVVDQHGVEEIEAHLALCDGCEEYVAQIRQTMRMLRRMPVRGLSESVRADILAAFRTTQAAGSGKGESRDE
jgi:anti-sigma factor RsiW